MKAQINLEFLAAAAVYLTAIGGIIFASSAIPEFRGSLSQSSKYLEARTISSHLITQPGYYETSQTGTDWASSKKRIRNIESVGLANQPYIIDRQKLDNLTTVTANTGIVGLNYSKFQEVMRPQNQYRFSFTWYPTADTHKDFVKGNPPKDPDGDGNNENFIEPSTDRYREEAGNKVNYGQISLNGIEYNLLLTSHNGVYDTLRKSNGDWNFESEEQYAVGEEISLAGRNYVLKSLQNRDNEPGAAAIFKRKIKDFGSSPGNKETIRLTRYASMSGHPMRITVLTW